MSQEEPVYISGIKLNTESGPRLHMSIAKFGTCSADELKEIKTAMMCIAVELKPFKVTLGKIDWFGYKNDIEVILCKIEDEKIKKIFSDFWKKYDIKEHDSLKLHVTTKKQKEKLLKMGEFEADNFFVKQIGVKKYIFSVDF